MLQQVMTNPGEIIFREVPVPEIKDDQVLVKIMNIGICDLIFMDIMENIHLPNIRLRRDMKYQEKS